MRTFHEALECISKPESPNDNPIQIAQEMEGVYKRFEPIAIEAMNHYRSNRHLANMITFMMEEIMCEFHAQNVIDDGEESCVYTFALEVFVKGVIVGCLMNEPDIEKVGSL